MRLKGLIALTAILILALTAVVQAEYPDQKGLGVKVGLGGLNSFPIGVSFEMPLKSAHKNLGVGGQFMYMGYSEDWAWGTYSYTNMYITAFGSYILDDFYKLHEKLSTFGRLNLGWWIFSSSWESKGSSIFTPQAASGGGLIWTIDYVAKYSINDKLKAILELGYGLGYIKLGVEYGL